MTTVSELIDECSAMLHSYTGNSEASTFLTETITSTTDTIPVAHPTRLLQGLIEVGDELMLVKDQGDASVTLMPNGRGMQNTASMPHFVNTRVINDPLVPRARIFSELKATVLQLRRDLWVVKTTTFLVSPTQAAYELPVDCRRVLKVESDQFGPSRAWHRLRYWTLDMHADTTSGKSITIAERVDAGRTIQVTYAADVPVPTSTGDDLEGLGIPEEWHDLLRYGTCWRNVQMMAPSRLNLKSVESQTLAPQNPVDTVAKVAQQFFGMFQLRREEEARRLKDSYPPRPHRVR